MTYLVNENCIKCKHMDCVEVCPVDCFYEGENMLVIHPIHGVLHDTRHGAVIFWRREEEGLAFTEEGLKGLDVWMIPTTFLANQGKWMFSKIPKHNFCTMLFSD